MRNFKVILLALFSVAIAVKSLFPEPEQPNLREMSIGGISLESTAESVSGHLSSQGYKVLSGRRFVQFDAKTEGLEPGYVLIESESPQVGNNSLPTKIEGSSLKAKDFLINKGQSVDVVWEHFPSAKPFKDSTSHGIIVTSKDASLRFYLGENEEVSVVVLQPL